MRGCLCGVSARCHSRSWSRSRSRSRSWGRSRSRSRSPDPAAEEASRPAGYGPIGANLAVGGLPPSWVADKKQWATAKKQLRLLFAQYGTVLSIRSAAINPNQFVGGAARRRAKIAAKGPRNRCFLSYSKASEADAGIAALEGVELEAGRKMKVSMGQDQGLRDMGGDPVEAPQRDQAADDGSALPSEFSSRDTKADADQERQREAEYDAGAAGVCTMCGQPGHFAQGCPLTLGALRAPGPDAAAAAVAGTVARGPTDGELAAKKAAAHVQALAVLRSEELAMVEPHTIQLIVGAGGRTIQHIRETSGATVRCLDPMDSEDAERYHEMAGVGERRLVEIKGLSGQVAEAKRLVLQVAAGGGGGGAG